MVGRFADWMEGEFAYARTYDLGSGQRIKGQLSLGGGQIGNKGMRSLHISIHKAIGMQTTGLEYTNQPVGKTEKYDASVGDAFRCGASEFLVSLGNSRDPATSDLYLQGNAIIPLTSSIGLGVEARMIRQYHSEIYDHVDLWREEASFALRIYKYYQPSFKYVSQYMVDDTRGQFYAELLRFNIPF